MRFRFTAPLLGSLLFLSGCQSTGAGRTRRELKQTMDSGSNACRQNPVYCTRAVGEETVLPVSLRASAQAGASVAGALKVMDEAAWARVRQIVEKCANEADWEVNDQYLAGKTPTQEQCQEKLGETASGQTITRGMKLGQLKHEAAARCVQARLSVERPGGFSLDQRYRYDFNTKALELISAVTEQELIKSGRTGALRGTLVPDVVIHSGNPLRAELVFDFKFPCPVGGESRWHRYPEGHPFENYNQGQAYELALQAPAFRVSPILGAYP
ncbi:hypothetical protein OV207_21775 [Corallococcus sp. BB11-1]|uniref:hypothetical protein n=1 Tax=Corallococcus sp. BB11-1 TaxID=2996783 RepID=UPI00227175A7|nr:hypothetical protein [Corallococcus sp. BB11-1]MCY1034098.1 hypothetical protein [Corallococcus sp. BB11-1]